MGTTIRRQPITTSIPASPDYKFLNITNFGGIEKSSNPFVVSSNTASDCLNVYVDEDNALSTRPRLYKRLDLSTLGYSLGFKNPKIFKVSDNEFVCRYMTDDGSYDLKKIKFSSNLDSVDFDTYRDVSSSIFKLAFNQGSDTYVVLGNDYYKLLYDGELEKIVPYIPTTTIGKSEGIAGSSYESLNVLTNEYKETYYWDGESDLSKVLFSGDVISVNNKYKQTVTIKNPNNQTSYIIKPVPDKKHNLNGVCFATLDKTDFDTIEIEFIVYDAGKNTYTTIDRYTVIDDDFRRMGFNQRTSLIDCSDDGRTIAILAEQNGVGETSLVYIIRDGVFEGVSHAAGTAYSDLSTSSNVDTQTNFIQVSSDGKKVVWFHRVSSTEYNINIAILSSDGSWTTTSKSYNRLIGGISIAPDVIFCKIKSSDTAPFTNEFNELLLIPSELDDPLPNFSETLAYDNIMTEYVLSQSGNLLYVSDYPNNHSYLYIKNNNDWGNRTTIDLSFRKIPKHEIGQIAFSKDDERLYFGANGYYSISDDKFIYTDDVVITPPENGTGVQYKYIVNDSKLIFLYNNDTATFVSYIFDSNEPLLELVKTLSDEEKNKNDSLRENLFTCYVTTQFDNNRWFGGRDCVFHTEYNNIGYIPQAGFFEIDVKGSVNGFNILSDDVLAVYSTNNIMMISPITVGDYRTYSLKNSKNLSGNVRLNGPCTTPLTNMAVHFSNTGVLALSQIQNVQSPEHVTTLISEIVNDKLLTTFHHYIREHSLYMFSHKYWTFFVGATTDDTKVFLLDDRTQQWFYWELPIIINNCFEIGNNVMFITNEGVCYCLTTDDAINEYNTNVTEYYDDLTYENKGKKLIPWHWTSQILSLNTINYSKKLIDTTFILTDTDSQDEYGLDYSFKAWRKSVSETNATSINSNIHYIQSTTKRTMIPRFNFIQIKLSNTEDDLDNNKLRLVGLGLKYVLLEGLY